MKLQHETSLIQPGLVSASVNPSTLLAGQDNIISDQFTSVASFNAIEHCAWSKANSSILCVYLGGQNQVHVFDSKSYDKKEKFSLKPIDKKYSRQSFTVKGFEFSPDGTRLAIGQTDCIVYIYKLGANQPLASPISGVGGTSQLSNGQLGGSPNQQYQQSGATGGVSQSTTMMMMPSSQSGSRPTITGKFANSTPITCLLWSDTGIVFGTQDGKVKLISTASPSASSGGGSDSSSNKVITLIVHQALTVALVASSSSANMIVAGFMDGSVIVARSTGATPTSKTTNRPIHTKNLVIDHSCAPFSLCLTPSNHLCVGGSDGKLYIGQIYSQEQANGLQSGELSIKGKQIIDIRSDLQRIACSPSSDALVVGTNDKILVVKLDSNQLWRLCYCVTLKNAIMITSLVWSPDGSQVIAGTLNGALELFSCQWNRRNISDKFEISYMGRNQITVKNLRQSYICAVIRSNYDIASIRLVQDGRYAIAWTSQSLLLARMAQPGISISFKVSEIDWSGMSTQNVRFCFHYMNVVAISLAGELMIVELGVNKILFSVRSDYASRHLISIKGFDQQPLASPRDDATTRPKLRSFCYMVDAKTLCIVDVDNRTQLFTWSNNVAVDWLELSDSGHRLLYRDKSLQLYYLHLGHHCHSQHDKEHQANKQVEPVKLLNSCGFAQWVNESDVIVAQSLGKIYVWYDIDKPVVYDAKGASLIRDGPSEPTTALSTSANLSEAANANTSCPDVVSIERQQAGPQFVSVVTRIVLSNGASIVLDMIYIEFDTALRDGDLVRALSLLESRNPASSSGVDVEWSHDQTDSRQTLASMWRMLADKAVALQQLPIAERALAELGQYTRCRYLRWCHKDGPGQCEWRLALYQNDWATFESLADMEIITTEYKRLNRWTQAIAYLERMGQYRQKDLVERDYHQWLLAKGQLMEMARRMARSGELIEALELLLRDNRLKFAARLLLDHYGPDSTGPINSLQASRDHSLLMTTTRLTTTTSTNASGRLESIIRELKDKLMDGRHYEEAAQLCESRNLLNEPSEALKLYIKASAYSKAIAIARTHYPEEVVKLEEQYADHILYSDGSSALGNGPSQARVGAIEHYIEAGKLHKALGAAMELGQYDKAAQIVPSMDQIDDNETIVDYCKQIGDYYRAGGHTEEAVRFYRLAKHNQEAIDSYLERSEFSKAHQVAMELMEDKQQVMKMFNEVAERLAHNEHKFKDAEKIYLMLGQVDQAIDMYKRMGHYDDMVALIRVYHADLIENSLIMLAGELESQGQLEEAERYYLLASQQTEWKNVVRMYRNANRWQDAYRVCDTYEPSGHSMKVQIAYWWSKSLASVEESVRLIVKLGPNMVQPVLSYAVECKNFDYALDMVKSREFKSLEGDARSNEWARTITVKYAAWLEQQGQYHQAERYLVEAGQIAEAVDMYMEGSMFVEALRLAQQHPKLQYQPPGAPSMEPRPLIEKVLLGHADHLLRNRGANVEGRSLEEALNQAQQLYLRANRADLAVEMYRSRSMWQKALEVARKFAPNLLFKVEQSLETSHGVSPMDTMDQIGPESRAHQDNLFEQGGLRMNGFGQPPPPSYQGPSSADSNFTRDRFEADSGAQADSTEPIGDQMSSSSDVATLMGKIAAAIDRDERRHVKRLVCKYVTGSINSNEAHKAVNFILDIGARCRYIYGQQEVVSLILRLAAQTMSNCQWGVMGARQDFGAGLEIWLSLRDTILQVKLLNEYELVDTTSDRYYQSIVDTLNKHLMAAHYISLHYTLMEVFYEHQQLNQASLATDDASFGIQQSALGLLARLATSLLRYADVVRADRAFYVAGFWCNTAKRLDMAYIFWNHLLDLLEAAETTSHTINSEQFKGTDIPTNWQQGLLQMKQDPMSSDIRSQVQNWVLQTLLELETPPSLPHDHRGVYEGSLLSRTATIGGAAAAAAGSSSGSSKNLGNQTYPACLISGYPVLEANESVQFGRDYAARHKDWNAFVSLMRHSSSRGKQSLCRVLDFISKLTGSNRDTLEEYKFGPE